MLSRVKYFDQIVIGCILVLVFVLYFQVYQFQFVWDDTSLIRDNNFIQGALSFKSIFLRELWDISGNETSNPPFYRPIVTLAYTIEYHIFGLNAGGYHMVNLILHILNGFMIWLISKKIGVTPLAGAIASSLFLFHPTQVNSVCFISSHGDILALFFSLISLRIWICDSNKKFYALIFIFLAILSKEVAIFLPVICIGYDFLLRGKKLSAAEIWIPLVSWIPYFILRYFAIQNGGEFNHFSMQLWKSPGSFRIFLLLGRIFFPIPNPPDLKVPLLTNIQYVFFHIAALCLTLITLFRTKQFPEIRFFILWFFLSIILVADYPNVGMRFSDQFLYYSLMPISIIFGILCSKIRTWYVVYVPILILCIFLTYGQIPAWQNSVSLWSRAVNYDPTNPVYSFSLSSAYKDIGQTNKSCEQLRSTLKLLKDNFEVSTYKSTAHNFGNCILYSNPDLAEQYFESVLVLDQRYIPSLNNLIIAYLNQHKTNQALSSAEKLISLNPVRSESWSLLGNVYEQLKNQEKAQASFTKAQSLLTKQ